MMSWACCSSTKCRRAQASTLDELPAVQHGVGYRLRLAWHPLPVRNGHPPLRSSPPNSFAAHACAQGSYCLLPAAAEAAAAATQGGSGEEGGGAAGAGASSGVVVNLEPGLDELLEEALRRSGEKATWKVWQWPSGGVDFYDSETFRRYLESEVTPEELRRLLPSREAGSGGAHGAPGGGGSGSGSGSGSDAPAGGGAAGEEGEKVEVGGGEKAPAAATKPVERPAEAALRLRM
jgi:hypothetical protein